MQPLEAGDSAPDFTLPTADGGTVSLADYRGSRVVVYFYPAAMTAGCTTEACDFRDSLQSLVAARTEVLGVSPDSVDRLAEFAEKESLTFPLASDPERRTIGAWGALAEKVKDGVAVTSVVRSTFVIGPDGRFERIYRGVSADGHVADLKRDLAITG
ncbi:MAG: peroxiredoxin [Microcella sp.]|uniref:peroxiredoxin n=1 Tax=Microcella sp. TaxID=1913979 RepID=UPI0033156776